MDLSWNSFSDISKDTFGHVPIWLSHRVTAIHLQNNKLQSLQSGSFAQFKNICVLDLSNCGLRKSLISTEAFVGLGHLRYLFIHGNKFDIDGYPDVAISYLSALHNLSVDVFYRFQFDEPFQKLKQLGNIQFHPTHSSFYLTNSTFTGLSESPIVYLNMNFNFKVFCNISEEIFCSFPFLKGVAVDFGGFCDLIPVLRSLKCLQNKTLEYLNLQSNTRKSFVVDIVFDKWNSEYLFNICMQTLDLSGNRISNFLVDPFKSMLAQCIKTLYIGENHLSHIDLGVILHILVVYPKLQTLLIENNGRGKEGAKQKRVYPATGFFPFADSTSNYELRVSNHLKVFDYSENFIHTIKIPIFKINLIALGLEELYVPHTNWPCEHLKPLQTPELRIINMSGNDCSKISPSFFEFSTNLSTMIASNANLPLDGQSDHQSLFRNLTNLQNLDLSVNQLVSLPNFLFKDQHKSMSSLNLDNNFLIKIPLVVKHLQSLTKLFIRHNKIESFGPSDIDVLLRQVNVSLFLEGNPLSCSCSKLASLTWMKNNRKRIGDWQNIKCLENNKFLSKFVQDKTFRTFELNCQSKEWLIYTSLTLALTVIAIVLAALVKRYRVHIDYVILKFRNRWRGIMQYEPKENYQFDVFLSFSDEDYAWVVNILYNELTKQGIHVSFPDKDFVPGISKADELLRCIDDSRKVVFVITEEFLACGWESYVVQMTVTHAFNTHREGSLIILIKNNIALERMPKDLKYVWWAVQTVNLSDFQNNPDDLWHHVCTMIRSS